MKRKAPFTVYAETPCLTENHIFSKGFLDTEAFDLLPDDVATHPTSANQSSHRMMKKLKISSSSDESVPDRGDVSGKVCVEISFYRLQTANCQALCTTSDEEIFPESRDVEDLVRTTVSFSTIRDG